MQVVSHPFPSMDIAYLFIDGSYLREVCDEYMHGLFEVEADIDLAAVKHGFVAKKVFYYDCLDDVARRDEAPDELKARVGRQQERFDKINSIPGFHVRLGTLAGTKPGKLRQK